MDWEMERLNELRKNVPVDTRMCVIDTDWMEAWVSFVQGNGDPPGEIDNQSIKLKLVD